jgi:ATP/maltotriose-dependent transcriptional regulator MalT
LVAVVARERLYQLLDDRLAHPTVWVTGPPGAGKTTLLSGYAESRKRPTLWYQLDSGDADIATFFYYLGVAAQSLAAGRHALPLPALTPEYLPDLIGFTRRFFRELFARLPRHALLVLDDYQDVPADSRLHGVIAAHWGIAGGRRFASPVGPSPA